MMFDLLLVAYIIVFEDYETLPVLLRLEEKNVGENSCVFIHVCFMCVTVDVFRDNGGGFK
jgi:hypothetical protein